MLQVCLFGSGKIGITIATLLTSSGRYKVKVCDVDLARAKEVATISPQCEAHALNLDDSAATKKLLGGCRAVISALPYHCNTRVAALAVECGVHYFDLTEDVRTTQEVMRLSNDASSCLMPQCGLAPGFISIAAMHLIRSFDVVDTVKMRVGALPLYPSNALKYNLTWSTEGLINEYGNMCELIDDREKHLAFPLEGYERLSLDGDEYEAFNTSGGLGTLCETMLGKVRKLDYKTIRYPGHRELIAFLMNDLRFNEDRDTLRKVFERSLTTTSQDKCIVFVEVRGQSEKRFVQRTYASAVYNANVGSRHFGAIQLTTAAGICAPLDLLLTGKTAESRGFLRCEDISLSDFLDNEFGRYYRDEKALSGVNA